MKTQRGTDHADTLAGSGNESYQLIGLGGNDTYAFRLFDYVVNPPPVEDGDPGGPKTYYVRDSVVETANGGVDTVNLSAHYNPVDFTGIYPNAIVTAAELANIEKVVLGSAGHSRWIVSTDDHANTVHGSTGGDTLNGNAGNDHLHGGGGADVIDGGRGADFVYGDGGNDRIKDLLGDNRLFGGAGNDTLTAGSGHDMLSGDGGNDVLIGGAGGDRLVGGAGIDTVSYADAAKAITVSLSNPSMNTGEAAGDTYSSVENIMGSGHDDTLIGNIRANRLDGAAGNDTLQGGGGDDRLYGGMGTDLLDGGAGNDQFFVAAGEGGDDLVGGAGQDVFNFSIDTKIDDPLAIIHDFQDGLDSIHVTGVADVVAAAEQVGQDVVLTLGKFVDLGMFGTIFNPYGTITLLATDIADITSADLSGVPVVHDGMTF